jgi:predicted PurR-regulated permease PerM
MEGLAALVTVILLVIYSSGLFAFALSWMRNRIGRIISRVFAVIAIVTGVLLAIVLIDGNGVMVGGIPVLLGAFSLYNSIRRNR